LLAKEKHRIFKDMLLEIPEFFEWLEGLGTKDMVSCEIWGFLGDFCGILEGLWWFRTYT
jgi:hypothetical protein